MTTQEPDITQHKPNRFVMVFGMCGLVCVALYYAFEAINSYGLDRQEATARVTGKEFREPASSYAVQPVGKQTQLRVNSTPEMWVLKLDMGGEKTEAAVERSHYDSLQAEDEVRVEYERRRVTRTIRVLNVNR